MGVALAVEMSAMVKQTVIMTRNTRVKFMMTAPMMARGRTREASLISSAGEMSGRGLLDSGRARLTHVYGAVIANQGRGCREQTDHC